MRIGLDVDGVLNDFEAFQTKHGIAYFVKKRVAEGKFAGDIRLGGRMPDSVVMPDPNGYGIREMFGCTQQEEEQFWMKYIIRFSLLAKPQPGASEAIRSLRRQGNTVWIITSRAKTNEHGIKGAIMRWMLRVWLLVNRIGYDGIEWCSLSRSDIEKRAACVKHGIDVMLEDKRENADEIRGVAHVLLFTTRANAGYRAEHVTRVDGFSQALREIGRNPDWRARPEPPFQPLGRDVLAKLVAQSRLAYNKRLQIHYINSADRRALHRQDRQYALIMMLGKWLFDLLFKYEVSGRENVPRGNYLMVCNHRDKVDLPLMMCITADRPLRPLAKAELLSRPDGKLLRFMGAIFVDRADEHERKRARDDAIRALLVGENVLVTPEGTRNRTDAIVLPYKIGAASMAQKTGVPLLPVVIYRDIRGGKVVKRYARIMEPVRIALEDDLEQANAALRDAMINALVEVQTRVESGKACAFA